MFGNSKEKLSPELLSGLVDFDDLPENLFSTLSSIRTPEFTDEIEFSKASASRSDSKKPKEETAITDTKTNFDK
jgi:hypothetical protein